MSAPSSSCRPPVYFFSIGGPNFIESTTHPAYTALSSIGLEINTKVKPKAVVVFSAHWRASSTKIAVNVAERTDLIYDFHGFPKHYYEYEYPNKGSPEVADKVVRTLEGVGIGVERVMRGLDHGVWAGFGAAFDTKKNPLNVSIVQVSLFKTDDTDQHYRLGQALESLRDEGILIIGAGISVHNLRDFRATRGIGGTMPYAHTFDEALKEAVETKPEGRRKVIDNLMKRSDARQAHPSLEHLLPVFVAAGAAGRDVGEQLWTLPEGSLSWAQFRFGGLA